VRTDTAPRPLVPSARFPYSYHYPSTPLSRAVTLPVGLFTHARPAATEELTTAKGRGAILSKCGPRLRRSTPHWRRRGSRCTWRSRRRRRLNARRRRSRHDAALTTAENINEQHQHRSKIIGTHQHSNTHAGAGSNRAALTPPAPPQAKRTQLDTSAGAGATQATYDMASKSAGL